MARFYGSIGFESQEETRPGIFIPSYVERSYKGDLVKRFVRWTPTEHMNDDLNILNDISIIADTFIDHNFGAMRYVKMKDQMFSIESATIDPDTHRLTISLGGLFHVPESD